MKNNNGNGFFRKIYNKISNLIFKFRSLSFVKHILMFYLFITVIGSLLLFLPVSHQAGVNVKYIDALFTSASAFSDTGLATMTTATTWSHFGQAIIAILILVGGIGWFALKIYFLNILFGRTISFKSRETLSAERGSSKVGNTRRLVKISVTILIILILLATLILTLYFYFVKPDSKPFTGNVLNQSDLLVDNPYHNISTSIRFGIFHAISGLNNAGFDIIGSGSLQPYYHKYGLQIIFIVLFVIGGIGYPVIYDVYQWVVSKFTKKKFRWSLFTKISMISYVAIVVIGLSSVFGFETTKLNGFWRESGYGTKSDRTMALIFNTMSTRNAGFATINIHSLSSGTKILYTVMMFIGSAPSSTAGGIRTTTIAIVLLGLWSRIRGKKSVRVFNRKITPDTVQRSYVVTTVALLLVMIGSFIMMTSWDSYGGNLSESKFGLSSLIFETASAFGTTGLSLGITSAKTLSSVTKLSLILIMLIGQLGVSSTLLVWDSKKNKSRNYSFVEEDITIG